MPSEPLSHPDPQSEPIDTLNRLRIVSCPDCGIQFALPQQVWALRLAGNGDISCPNGHRFLVKSDADSEAVLSLLNVQLLAELTQSRHELQTARHEIARLPHPPVSPVSEAELKRRINLTVILAPRAEYGKPICIRCAKKISSNSHFRWHLKKEHAEEISNMPANAFD